MAASRVPIGPVGVLGWDRAVERAWYRSDYRPIWLGEVDMRFWRIWLAVVA